MRLDSALRKSRPQYISAQKISTLFDALYEREIARSFSDAREFMAVPVSYYFLSLNQSYKLSGLLSYTHVVKDGKGNLSLAEDDQPCDPLLTYLQMTRVIFP